MVVVPLYSTTCTAHEVLIVLTDLTDATAINRYRRGSSMLCIAAFLIINIFNQYDKDTVECIRFLIKIITYISKLLLFYCTFPQAIHHITHYN